MESVSLVRVDQTWHVFADREAADTFYRHWSQFRDAESLIDVAVDQSTPDDVREMYEITPTVEERKAVTDRLEYLRQELRAERISYGELAELQGLAEHIEPGDVELLEAAGVPEFPEQT